MPSEDNQQAIQNFLDGKREELSLVYDGDPDWVRDLEQDCLLCPTVTKLRILVIKPSPISNLPKTIGKLQDLRSFSLSPLSSVAFVRNPQPGNLLVKHLEVLQNLPHLENLDLTGTKVQDLSLLRHLNSLKNLSLDHSATQDLSPLAEAISLETLYLTSNPIHDLGPLRHLEHLQKLDLSFTKIQNLRPLSGLTSLHTLKLNQCPVTDISPLIPLIQTGIPLRLVNHCEEALKPGLFLHACPLSHPPMEVALQGNQAILDYFAKV